MKKAANPCGARLYGVSQLLVLVPRRGLEKRLFMCLPAAVAAFWRGVHGHLGVAEFKLEGLESPSKIFCKKFLTLFVWCV